MATIRSLNPETGVKLVRPLLTWCRRSMTEAFCNLQGIEFRNDSMNDDLNFARVRIRKQIIPMLGQLNPKAVENIARAATLLSEDERALNVLATELMQRAECLNNSADCDGDFAVDSPGLRADVLKSADPGLRRRAIRIWLESGRGNLRRIERVHVLAVDRLTLSGRGGRIAELPGGMFVQRKGRLLTLKRLGNVEKGRVAD